MSRTRDLDTTLGAVLDLIQFFRNGHCTTTAEIAVRYGVTQRTAQRWLQLVERHVPLQRNGPNYRREVLR